MTTPALLEQINKLASYLHVPDIQGLRQLATRSIIWPLQVSTNKQSAT